MQGHHDKNISTWSTDAKICILNTTKKNSSYQIYFIWRAEFAAERAKMRILSLISTIIVENSIYNDIASSLGTQPPVWLIWVDLHAS